MIIFSIKSTYIEDEQGLWKLKIKQIHVNEIKTIACIIKTHLKHKLNTSEGRIIILNKFCEYPWIYVTMNSVDPSVYTGVICLIVIITHKIIFHWTSYILIMHPIHEMKWSPILLINDRQTWAFEVPVQYTGPFVYMISGEIFYGQVTGVFANITGYCFHLYIQEWYSYKLNSWSRTTFWKLKITKSYKIKLYIILTIQ